ncbi:MAG TPA: hypothetical protein VNO14_19220 [Blastocatellia bacterium]|nr:hypothetical protein [Blastocatellia bacterium]
MTTAPVRTDFTGPFSNELEKIAELIEWLESNHRMSFVKAGDDKVFAYGGRGYVLVFDESKWQGLIEVITPAGAATIKPDESGKLNVTATTQDEKAIKALLEDAAASIRRYYESRYWTTPEIS